MPRSIPLLTSLLRVDSSPTMITLKYISESHEPEDCHRFRNGDCTSAFGWTCVRIPIKSLLLQPVVHTPEMIDTKTSYLRWIMASKAVFEPSTLAVHLSIFRRISLMRRSWAMRRSSAFFSLRYSYTNQIMQNNSKPMKAM